MVTDVIKSCDSIQQQLEKAKSNLKGLNDDIRRIIGRDPQDTHLRGDRKRSFNDSRRGEFNATERQRRDRDVSPQPQAKKRNQEAKSVFSRLSGPPHREDENRPKIYSRVIRELPTRQEIVAAQGNDEQSKARNRRMFGCLLGTLQKFCQEESRLREKEEMKAQIEKKLEEQIVQERENLKKERQNLFSDRKRQQLEIRMLELKMIRMQEFETWERSKKDLQNFIRTKSKPHIYFRPKTMNSKCEKRLSECNADLKKEIEKKRNEVNEEVYNIELRFKSRSDRTIDRSETVVATKHDRRNNNQDEEENDHDSFYEHSDNEAFNTENSVKTREFPKNERKNDNIASTSTNANNNSATNSPSDNCNMKTEDIENPKLSVNSYSPRDNRNKYEYKEDNEMVPNNDKFQNRDADDDDEDEDDNRKDRTTDHDNAQLQ